MSGNEIKNPKIGGVRAAKVPVEEMELPTSHGIVSDWIKTLGDKAYVSYIHLLVMAYDGESRVADDPANINSPLENVMKKLGIGSKTTFYNKVIKPLWNYGFIDLETYEGDGRKTQKPVNIIVYPYPCLEFSRKIRPLEKVRDYETDYNSEAKIYANMKRKKPIEAPTVQKVDDTVQIMDDTVQKVYGAESSPTVQKVYGADEPETLDMTTVQKMYGSAYRTESVRKDLNKEININKNNINKTHTRAYNISDLKSIELEKKALSVGFTEAEAIHLVNLVTEKGILDQLTDEIVLECFALVELDLEKNIVKCELGKWTAGKFEHVLKNQPRKLNVPKKQGDVPANKKVYPKRAGGRKEMVPGWVDKEKDDEKPGEIDENLAEKAKRLRELGIGVGSA